MEKSVTRDETLKAEILWALKVIMSHYSYKSCEGTSKLFQAMFPDRIASQFSYGEKKCAYLICFGLAPHFEQLLKDIVKKEEAFVLMFDESLNSVLAQHNRYYEKLNVLLFCSACMESLRNGKYVLESP